ncbi:hypothetical protein NDU88_002829 [Pleurodeles waltl]|uniref:Uncharacterized protein n=1 Tax=Pleurodeles waltl TaxID=8319 RepID=A0AAV7V0U2_PLEWA|nr:hypothetical protein NDU88_002829 [Pleurodeles waltl]
MGSRNGKEITSDSVGRSFPTQDQVRTKSKEQRGKTTEPALLYLTLATFSRTQLLDLNTKKGPASPSEMIRIQLTKGSAAIASIWVSIPGHRDGACSPDWREQVSLV